MSPTFLNHDIKFKNYAIFFKLSVIILKLLYHYIIMINKLTICRVAVLLNQVSLKAMYQ